MASREALQDAVLVPLTAPYSIVADMAFDTVHVTGSEFIHDVTQGT